MGLCNRSIDYVEFPKFQTEIFVEWKAPQDNTAFLNHINREEKSLRHVAMVAKFLDLDKLWSCKYGRKKIDM